MMSLDGRTLLQYLFVCVMVAGLAGCAGPLDKAAEQALKADFTGDVYQTKCYLGNELFLAYTNNSVAGRSPTGLFIDRAFNTWYETDASFWGAGTSGHHRTLHSLQLTDRDLDFEHYAQGISAGQLVRMHTLSDKRDRLIVSFETLGRYEGVKDYRGGSSRHPELQTRVGRIHFLLGKEGMKPFDRSLFEQMLDRVLVKVEPPVGEAQRRAFALARYPQTPLADLSRFTGLSGEAIREIYYSSVLTGSELSTVLQSQLAAELANASEQWPQEPGIWLKELESGSHLLSLHCDIQEISNSVRYHSFELRAGLLFFDGALPLLKDLKSLLLNEEMPQSVEQIGLSFSYPYFNRNGRRSDETLRIDIPLDALQRFLRAELSGQELADRSEILLGDRRLKVSQEAQSAVENMALAQSTTWKNVTVQMLDYDYEEDESGKFWVITGEVINRGTWIAKEIEVTAKGYSRFGFTVRKASTDIDGLLKPKQTEKFTIELKKEDVKRLGLEVEWKVVE